MRAFQWKKALISAILSLSILVPSASAAYVATTTPTTLNFRSGASTASAIVGRLSAGTKIAVLELENDWAKVAVNGMTGYVNRPYIQSIADCDFAIGNGTVTGSVVNIRQEPGTHSTILAQVSQGTTVSVVGIKGYWFKVTYGSTTGYIHPDYLTISRRDADISRGDGDGSTVNASTGSTSTRNAVVSYAKGLLGKAYVYGKSGPNSFDCSGFTMYVMKNAAGISLPHNAASQYSSTTKIAKDSLAAGDLVYFNGGTSRITHVGIYIGGGQFIHASTNGNQVRIDSLGSKYYSKVYAGASRVIF